jgi:cytochrome b pre-mRNA-processing protein 3
MILQLFRRIDAKTFDSLYGAIVAQARQPVFYAGLGVPDTVEGRFEMIVLHLVLVLRRLRRGPRGRDLTQGVFDAFCRDLDHNLRELGVGDLSVPKKMKRFAEAFYGRQRAYEDALAAADPALLGVALGRNVFSGNDLPGVNRLADYTRGTAAQLDALDGAALAAGRLAFSDPDAILADAQSVREIR